MSPEEDRQRRERLRRCRMQVFGTFFGTLALLILGATCGAYLGQRLLGVPETSLLGTLRIAAIAAIAAIAVVCGAVDGVIVMFLWIGNAGSDALMSGGEVDLPNDPLSWYGVFCLVGAGIAPLVAFWKPQPGLVLSVLAACLPITVGASCCCGVP